jgi:hypothetical protein
MDIHSHHGHFEFSGMERGRNDTLSWNGHSLIMDTLSSLGWKEVRVTL